MFIGNRLLQVLPSFTAAMLILTAPPQIFNRRFNLLDNNGQTNSDPCEQAKPFVEKATDFSKTAVYRAALKEIQNKATANTTYEYTIGFGKDSQGNIISSGIIAGGRSSSNVPAVFNGFADLHNHPKNTPPSSGDLYGLIRKNKKNNSYDTRYVVTRAGSVYAFVVTDTAATNVFLVKYPPQQVAGYSPLFPDDLLTEYRDIQHKYAATEEMAMAYMLEKYEVGVSLLKQDGNGDFKKLRTVVVGEGDHLVFETNNCK